MAERTPRQKAWASHGLKEVGRAVLDRFNKEVRPHLPKCNGTSRSTGLPCGNPAVAGKQKCRWHGGAVPSGDDWHKIQYPAATSKDWERKLNEKLKRAERNRRRQERRLAKMTPNSEPNTKNGNAVTNRDRRPNGSGDAPTVKPRRISRSGQNSPSGPFRRNWRHYKRKRPT